MYTIGNGRKEVRMNGYVLIFWEGRWRIVDADTKREHPSSIMRNGFASKDEAKSFANTFGIPIVDFEKNLVQSHQ